MPPSMRRQVPVWHSSPKRDEHNQTRDWLGEYPGGNCQASRRDAPIDDAPEVEEQKH
jgi:hypothetical protein